MRLDRLRAPLYNMRTPMMDLDVLPTERIYPCPDRSRSHAWWRCSPPCACCWPPVAAAPRLRLQPPRRPPKPRPQRRLRHQPLRRPPRRQLLKRLPPPPRRQLLKRLPPPPSRQRPRRRLNCPRLAARYADLRRRPDRSDLDGSGRRL